MVSACKDPWYILKKITEKLGWWVKYSDEKQKKGLLLKRLLIGKYS